ncbi:hypothetical protein M422DRAFT_242194 [Sphaerobolus stellatus SS14]|nr:hypothetical protein M422DRAFT_242194 [Sphaerobolus stellatus SS14]
MTVRLSDPCGPSTVVIDHHHNDETTRPLNLLIFRSPYFTSSSKTPFPTLRTQNFPNNPQSFRILRIISCWCRPMEESNRGCMEDDVRGYLKHSLRKARESYQQVDPTPRCLRPVSSLVPELHDRYPDDGCGNDLLYFRHRILTLLALDMWRHRRKWGVNEDQEGDGMLVHGHGRYQESYASK